MCSCNDKKKAADTFAVTLPDGSRVDVGSEVEAQMKVSTAGGGSYRKK